MSSRDIGGGAVGCPLGLSVDVPDRTLSEGRRGPLEMSVPEPGPGTEITP